MIEGSYEFFNILKNDRPQNRKTDTFSVCNSASTDEIAVIKWQPTWRRYVLVPNSCTIFDARCLAQLVWCLNKLMDERKQPE